MRCTSLAIYAKYGVACVHLVTLTFIDVFHFLLVCCVVLLRCVCTTPQSPQQLHTSEKDHTSDNKEIKKIYKYRNNISTQKSFSFQLSSDHTPQKIKILSIFEEFVANLE
jgi:hypothetical protein